MFYKTNERNVPMDKLFHLTLGIIKLHHGKFWFLMSPPKAGPGRPRNSVGRAEIRKWKIGVN